MRQPTFDETLTWLHFNFLLSQNFYNKTLCSEIWQIHGTFAPTPLSTSIVNLAPPMTDVAL